MKTIHYTKTLYYYDGPQVFEARDSIGGHYVALMVESEGSGDRYVVAGVAPEHLRLFRVGSLDLRSLMMAAAPDQCYLASFGETMDSPLVIEQEGLSLDDGPFLPDAGFVISDRPTTDSTLVEAPKRQALVVEGEFVEFDRKVGQWGLLKEDKIFYGRTREDGPSLDGLSVGHSYRFYCVEEIAAIAGTGRESRTLYLTRHEPL